jgi:protein-L-isoaspartate(D-aspartate) O-methyltransferase
MERFGGRGRNRTAEWGICSPLHYHFATQPHRRQWHFRVSGENAYNNCMKPCKCCFEFFKQCAASFDPGHNRRYSIRFLKSLTMRIQVMNAPSPEITMIKSQILPGNVLDSALLEALAATPRSTFLPDALKGTPCVDEDIEVSPGRYMMEPLVFARLLDLANIKPQERVLAVGCLAGYSLCVIARLAAQVIGIEEQRDMAERARQQLRSLNVTNAEIFTASLLAGYQVAAPYDVILVEGGVQYIPQSLLDQLAENGRLLTVETQAMRPGSKSGIGKALVLHKRQGVIHRQYAFDASVPLLPGFEQKKRFQF